MKKRIFLYSLTSLAVTASSFAYANPGQEVEVPALEGGITASVGTFLVTPTTDFQDYNYDYIDDEVTVLNVNPGYELGIDASLGYVFEETANSVEVFFRNITTSDTSSITEDITYYEGDLGYELQSFDLMFSQFVNLGEVMQLRFSGGLAYVDLESNQTLYIEEDIISSSITQESEFQGWGPRVGIDTRYGFDEGLEGLGIVGGASMAYYLGDMDTSSTENNVEEEPNFENNPGNHAVLNFRANLGLDYVYFFDNDEGSTLGLELGYLIDFYDDAIQSTNLAGDETGEFNQTTSLSFAGPYLQLKGVF